jgi:hypothetical protein
MATAGVVAAYYTPPEEIEIRAQASVERDKRGTTTDWIKAIEYEADKMSGGPITAPHREQMAEHARDQADKRREERRQQGW